MAAHKVTESARATARVLLERAGAVLVAGALAFLATRLEQLGDDTGQLRRQVDEVAPEVGQAVDRIAGDLRDVGDQVADLEQPALPRVVVRPGPPGPPGQAGQVRVVTVPTAAPAGNSIPARPRPRPPRRAAPPTPTPTPSPACLLGLVCPP